jgi:hypothetical protein
MRLYMYIVDKIQAVLYSCTVPIRRMRAKSGKILTNDVLRPSSIFSYYSLAFHFLISSIHSHFSLQMVNFYTVTIDLYLNFYPVLFKQLHGIEK